MSAPPPAWYPNPAGDGSLRWWDGLRWTEHVRPAVTDAPQPAQTSPDLALVRPEYRQAAVAWEALKDRGGLAGTVGGIMSAALGVRDTPAPVPQELSSSLQPYGPGSPLLEVGDLTFLRTSNPLAHGTKDVVEGIVGGRRGAGLIGSLVSIGAGLLAVLIGGFLFVHLMANGHAGAGETAARGTVVDQHASTDDGSRMCSPEASFTAGGETFRVRAGYSASSCPAVGSSITVIYTTTQPGDGAARIPEPALIVYLLLVVPVVGLVFLVLGIRGVRGSTGLLRQGLTKLTRG